MRVLRGVLLCVAFLASSIPALAVPPVFNGNVVTAGLPTYNVKFYGAKGDGTTDDTAAVNAAITAAANAGGGTIYFPKPTSKYLILGALTIPYTGPATLPVQPPIRLTGDGSAWNGYWATSPVNGSTVLDLQYTGGDGLYKAKIDTRGAGKLEIDHLTIEDTSSDNFLFIQTTNTTVHIHDNAFVGNPANTGTGVTQDAIRLGQDGYTATSANITSGSTTLTVGAGDPHFNANMVGWNVYLPTGGPAGGAFITSIATFVSSTQVTLANSASTTVTNGTAQFAGVGTDPNAAFQGYGSKIERNYYSHIQRGVIWGAFSNNITVADETYSTSCGSGLSNGAPYYFDSTPWGIYGNTIRGGTVEVVHYPYIVSVNGKVQNNYFDGIGGYDDSGTTLGAIYFGDASNSVYNLVIAGFLDPALMSSYMAGPGASLNTILGANRFIAINFNQGLSVGGSGLSVTAGGITTKNVVNADSANSNGLGLQLNGKNVVYSDGGGSNTNLFLNAPSSTTGNINFGHATAATAYGSISSSGYAIASSTYGPTSMSVNGSATIGTNLLMSSSTASLQFQAGNGLVQSNNGFLWLVSKGAGSGVTLDNEAVSATQSARFQIGGTTVSSVDSSGNYINGSSLYGAQAKSLCSGCSNAGYLSPSLTSAGAATANTQHSVYGVCAAGTTCTVNFTPSWTSSSSYSCNGLAEASQASAPYISAKTASSITFTLGTSAAFDYICSGT